MVGGLTKSPIWPSILSAVVGSPLHIPHSGQHAGALGAAILAGVGAGIFTAVKDGWNRVKTGERIEVPETGDIDVYQSLYADFCEEFALLES